LFYHWFTQYLNSFIGIIKNKNSVPSVLCKKGDIKSMLHKMLWSKGNKAFSVKEKFVKANMCHFVKTTKTSIVVCKLKN